MATLTTQSVTTSGLNPTYANAASGGDKVTPGERVFIHVKNGSGASMTVTVDDTISVSPSGATSFDPDLSVVIEPSGERMIGPLTETRFRNTSDLKADISYSDESSVTIAAIRV